MTWHAARTDLHRLRWFMPLAMIGVITGPGLAAAAPQDLLVPRLVQLSTVSGPVDFPPDCAAVDDGNTGVLSVDPANARHIVAAYTVGAGASAEVIASSHDAGRSWTRALAGNLTDCGNAGKQGLDPNVLMTADGRTWLSQGFLSSAPTAVEHQAVREYVSTAAAFAQPVPPVDVDPETPLQRGFMTSTGDSGVYLETQQSDYVGTYVPAWPSGTVSVRRSIDGGRSWSVAGTVTGLAPGRATLAGGLVHADGTLIAFVFDVNLATAAPVIISSGGASASGNLLAYRSDDGGRNWSQAGTVGFLGNCCLASVAAASDGTLYAAWPNASTNGTDISISVSRDGGRTWTISTAIQAEGDIPQAQIAVNPDGTVGLFWYAGGEDPAHPATVTPQLAISDDQGTTWSQPIALASPFDPTVMKTFNDTSPLGPYQGITGVTHGFALAFTVGGSNVRVGETADVDFARVTVSRNQ